MRVNWAIDYILANLHEPIRLEDVAAKACFSPFHFHRIFRSLLGETLQEFANRVRLERAIQMLSREPVRSLTDIALACGFGSSSNFSRVFKQQFGVPPSRFDIESFRNRRRQEFGAAFAEASGYHLTRLSPGENPDGFEARIRQLPPRAVAYIRVLDPYREGAVTQAAERLVSWAERRGLADGKWLGYMWDDPDIVAHADCRYDVGVVLPSNLAVEPEGEVGRLEFPAMRVAEVEVRGSIDLEQRALDWLFGTWLPGSGQLPSTNPCFESWVGRPFAHGFEHFELFVQLPLAE